MQPPLVVNEDSGFGTGQLPDKDGQMYYVNEDKLYLIPTAEVPVTNLYRDMIVGCRPVTDQKHGLLRLFPPGSRIIRKRRARIEPPAPVR